MQEDTLHRSFPALELITVTLPGQSPSRAVGRKAAKRTISRRDATGFHLQKNYFSRPVIPNHREQSGKLLIEAVARATLQRTPTRSQRCLAAHASPVSYMAALPTATCSAGHRLLEALGDSLPGTAVCKSTALKIRD